jgi:glycosyltransferase involved in cell wall biosynthesis
MIKISIVTPCFNAEASIQETMCSVLEQTAVISKRAELEYIICDGGSTDRTIEIISNINSPSIKLISEPDRGMYDALSKGLKLASGEIFAYINAGDYYHKCAFDIVLDLFEEKKINWLTGYTTFYNEKSYALPYLLPFKYRKRFFDCGMYLGKLPYVQQESTFWSAHLNSSIDLEFLSTLKVAGDFYMWQQFSSLDELKIVEAYLAGFKKQKGQLSENKDSYYQELASLLTRPSLLDSMLASFDKIMFYFAPNKIKKRMNNNGIFRFNHSSQRWD